MTTLATVPASYQDLIDRPLIATLAVTLPDGTPQATPVWFSTEGGYFYFNTAAGRLKDKAIRAKPYAALMILDPENGYRYIQIRGPIIEINEEVGRAHINHLAKRYIGADIYPGPPDETRLRYTLAPEHVFAQG